MIAVTDPVQLAEYIETAIASIPAEYMIFGDQIRELIMLYPQLVVLRGGISFEQPPNPEIVPLIAIERNHDWWKITYWYDHRLKRSCGSSYLEYIESDDTIAIQRLTEVIQLRRQELEELNDLDNTSI